jgi:uncharacterized protein involved in outer membrane biogenesis
LRKLLLAIGAVLLLFLVLIPLSLWLFVDPDDLRARASAYVKEYTGYDLTIGGPVNLSFVPWLGAEMQQVAIRPPGQAGGDPFAAFDQVGLKVRLLPLLRRHVEVGGVTASGGRILLAPAAGGTPARELQNFRLTSSGFGTAAANDLSIGFDVTGAGPTVPVSLTSRLVLDLERDLLELTDLTLDAADTRMTGRVQGKDLQKAQVWDAALKSDHVDLERLAPLFAALSSAPAGEPGRTEATAAPMTATIALEVGHLVAYGLQVSNVAIQAESRDGVLTAKPVRGVLYGGQGEFSLVRDDRQAEPLTRLAGTMTDVNLAPLLADLQQLQAFSGQGTVSFNVTARGDETARMQRTLAGDVTASARDGRIEGADFVKMVVQTHAMAAQLRGRPAMASVEPGEATSFSKLAGRTTLRGGVATIQELAIESPLFRATGDGTADLAAETLDITLRATTPETGDRVIPIAISGSFSDPQYSLQVGQILKDAAKEEVERQLQRGLQRLFRKPPG